MTLSTTGIAGGKSRQFAISNLDSIFGFYRPGQPLSRFVDIFWLYEGGHSDHTSERILPTGTLELVINLCENELRFCDAELPENRLRLSGAVVSGAQCRAFEPDRVKDPVIMGVHFKPGGAYPFLGLPTGDLSDTHVDLDALWGHSAGRLRVRLCEAKTAAERFRLLQEALLNRLNHDVEQHYAVSGALEMFGKHPSAPSVRDAAKLLSLSQRRFIQVFKTEVGLTPKLFSRIQRFQQTRTFIHQSRSPDWAGIALGSGYSDQSHLIREFQEFSGLSPTEYLDRHNDRIKRGV